MSLYGKNYFISEDDLVVTPEQIKTLIETFEKINDQIVIESTYNIDDLFIFKDPILQEATQLVDKQKLKSQCKIVGDKISKVIKEEGITRSSKVAIRKIYDDFIENISKTIKIVIPEAYMGKYDVNKITRAITLFIFLTIVSTISLIVLSTLFGPAVGNILLIAIVGPIIEETAKAVAIKGGYTVEFTVVFNACEFTEYTLMYGPIMGFAKMVGLRTIVIGMHCTTTIIQFLTQNEWIQKKLKLNKPEDQEKLTFIGRIIGNLIHILWNSVSVFIS